MSSIVVAGDTSGSVTLQAPAVAGSTTLTLPTSSGTVLTTASGQVLTAPVLGTPASGSLVNCTDVNYTGFKNRIINGGMVIDQRNAGASVTPSTSSSVYPIDRFVIYASQASKYTAQQNAGSVTPPVGFNSYLGLTSSSAYSVLTGDYFLVGQKIEGFNFADMAWGTANAATVTLSFWVRSSLTGTFGGALRNSANNRSYSFSYAISSANTWEQKTITIVGDTSGTWIGATNGTGVEILWSLGAGSTYSTTAGAWSGAVYFSVTGATSVVGTSGATFYITGVQLEKGSTATSFDQRAYSQELAMCQRYYEKSYVQSTVPATGTYVGANALVTANSSNGEHSTQYFKVTKRTVPTLTFYSPVTGTSGKAYNATTSADINTAITGVLGDSSYAGVGVAVTSGQLLFWHWTASAEL